MIVSGLLPKPEFEPSRLPTEIELGYFAAFLDGEGSIDPGIGPEGHVSISAVLHNSCRRPLDIALELFGGSLKDRPKVENRKLMYYWGIYGKNIIRFLEPILPHLLVKKEQARLALGIAYTYGKQGEPVDNTVKLFRIRIAQEIQKLNQGER